MNPQLDAPRARRSLGSLNVSRRTTGRAMVGVGIAGIASAIVGLIVGAMLVAQVEASVDDSLSLTAEALVAIDDSIGVTASIVETVRDGVGRVAATMATVQTSLEDSTSAIDDTAVFVGGSLPDALEEIVAVMPTIESVASTIDDALSVLERAPFGPSYDPVKPFDESIAELATAIDPLPDQLRTLSADFEGLSISAATMAADVERLGVDVEALRERLDEVGSLLDRYTSTTADAQFLAEGSRRDLAGSADLTRWLLVLVAIVFGVGQIVPIWLGLSLLRDDAEVHVSSASSLDGSAARARLAEASISAERRSGK